MFLKEHPDFKGMSDPDFTEFFAYMSLWYASLWVVLDGWKQMGIDEPEATALLADEQFTKLKDFRDVTLHYRPSYLDKKHMGFVGDERSVAWVKRAHKLIGATILAHLQKYAGEGSTEWIRT